MDRFDICLPYVLSQECPFPHDWSNPANFSNDKHDPGGKTFCGIIQREYDIWNKAHQQPCRDIRNITQGEGEKIYEDNYWLPHCLVLSPGLDLSFFDTAVNMGTTEAVKILQVVLGIDNDGLWGPKTADAVGKIDDVKIAISTFALRRKTIYRMMNGYPYFGKDWLRRSDEIGDAALAMASVA